MAGAHPPRICGLALRVAGEAPYFDPARLQFVAKPGHRTAVRGTIGMATHSTSLH